jgi:protein-L-isoaspartate O-methyltransferase
MLTRPATDEPALNGQIRRRAAFEAIITATRPEEIVETGTYRGATTAFLSQRFGLPVYSVERNRYFYLYSKLRLLSHWRTHVRHARPFSISTRIGATIFRFAKK